MLFRVFFAMLATNSAFAQSSSPDHTALAESESLRSDVRACAYSKFLGSFIDSLNDEEIASAVNGQQAEYSKFVENDTTPITKQEYRLRKKIERDFSALAKARAPRSVLKNAAQAICTVARTAGGTLLHEAALSASLVTSAFTFPLRFTAKFGIGLFTRNAEHERGPSFSEYTGEGWAGNLISVLFQSYKVAFAAGNPFLLGLYGVTTIDIALEQHCRGEAPISERSRHFCNAYEDINRVEYNASEAGRHAGAHIGKALLLDFDFRSDAAANPGLCQKNFKKQIRIGKRARERLLDQLSRDGMNNATVSVLPPEMNGCVGLRIANLTQAQKDNLETNYSGFTDGIPTITELKDEPTPTPSPVPSPTPDYSRAEEVCKAVYEAQLTDFVARPETQEVKNEIIQMTLSPARFGKLASDEVVVQEDQLIAEPTSNIAQGKNIVLIMAPSESQLAEYEAVLPRLEELKSEMDVEAAKLKWLKKSHSFEACVARQEAVEFNFPKFKELSEAIKQITVAQRIEEFRSMKKKADKAGHKLLGLRHTLKLDWEIREMSSLNVLRDTLNEPELLNLILVSHGNESGKIVDSRFSELAATAFEWIQPNLQSISFFSCHSDAAAKTYNLNDRLALMPSYHQIRSVNHVVSSELLEQLDETPVLALNTYIEAVDHAAYRMLLGNARVQMAFGGRMKKLPAPTQLCSVSFDGLAVDRGAFSLKLNQHWAGAVYAGEVSPIFSVPCDWIEGGELKAVLESISLTELPSVHSPEVVLHLHTPAGDLNLTNPVAKIRDDGSIARLTWSRQ